MSLVQHWHRSFANTSQKGEELQIETFLDVSPGPLLADVWVQVSPDVVARPDQQGLDQRGFVFW